jgi:uncharacterized membrane protein
MARRSFHAPAVVHIHGLLALSWILLFGVQTLLVRKGATELHMRLGIVALPLAVGILVSGVLVGSWTVVRDLPTTGQMAFASLAGTFTSLAMFTGLVAWALLFRRRPDWHKRLLLLATITVWWPAWFRWRHLFTGVPRPDLVFGLLIADLPILIAAIRDRIRYSAVHPVWLFVGPAVFLEQLFEVLNFGNGGWPALGKWLYEIGG